VLPLWELYANGCFISGLFLQRRPPVFHVLLSEATFIFLGVCLGHRATKGEPSWKGLSEKRALIVPVQLEWTSLCFKPKMRETQFVSDPTWVNLTLFQAQHEWTSLCIKATIRESLFLLNLSCANLAFFKPLTFQTSLAWTWCFSNPTFVNLNFCKPHLSRPHLFQTSLKRTSHFSNLTLFTPHLREPRIFQTSHE